MAMIQLMRVRYDYPDENAPKSEGSRLGASMSPNDVNAPNPDKTDKPMRKEGNSNDGKELLDEGLIDIRHDAIQAVSEKRFDNHVCSEILLNSGDKILVKQTISEVSRLITVAG